MNQPKTVRTRFAPSPSGFLHVGGARTALFNYLYAKAKKGKFILRVEDTDQERSSPESEKIILESLKWLGIHADEGPDEGGDFAPYRQSERLGRYKKYTETLLSENKAYPCFCSSEDLEASQEKSKKLGLPHIYDGRCRGLSKEEVEKRIAAGEKYAVRFRAESREIVVNDHVQGRVKFDSRLIGDFIIVKSDGFPSYNYAVVIDDHEMQISHVIRGVGHLSNTPRQILIHEALDFPLPEYAHISEIVGTDKKKLSKRKGATSILFFRDVGYMRDSFVNYMALLGWYPEDGVEYMPNRRLEEKFDIDRCSKSPAMFDFFLTDKGGGEDASIAELSYEELVKMVNHKTKLNWLNNKYIREMPLDDVWNEVRPFLEKDESLSGLVKKDPDKMKSTFDTLRIYLNTLSEAAPFIREILREDVDLDAAAKSQFDDPLAVSVIETFLELAENAKPADPENFTAVIKETGAKTGAKGKSLFMTIRVASTGTNQGLEIPILFAILGYEKVLNRIQSIRKKAGI
ncbi:MAG: glutamate--tRNA ligase [Spirochaetia bacterium]|nr:glutamate--tRNA ligase [Spirochaetia bacterium]